MELAEKIKSIVADSFELPYDAVTLDTGPSNTPAWDSFGQMVLVLNVEKEFDIILMDIRMPEMDGLQATAIIRSLNSEKSKIPIIALTADISAGNIAEYIDTGMGAVVEKPLKLPELLKAINAQLREEIHAPVEPMNSSV